MAGQRVASGHQGQGNQDLDLIIIDALEHLVRHQADGQTEKNAAARFNSKQPENIGGRDFLPSRDNLQQNQKDHHCPPHR